MAAGRGAVTLVCHADICYTAAAAALAVVLAAAGAGV